MDELLTVIKAIEPIGIAILIWRTRVADRERAELLKQQQEMMLWVRSIIADLMHLDRGN